MLPSLNLDAFHVERRYTSQSHDATARNVWTLTWKRSRRCDSVHVFTHHVVTADDGGHLPKRVQLEKPILAVVLSEFCFVSCHTASVLHGRKRQQEGSVRFHIELNGVHVAE